MIAWYINRLRTFSLMEVPYRIVQMLQKKYERYFVAGKKLPSVKEKNSVHGCYFFPEPLSLYEDTIDVFGKRFCFGEGEIDWHSDIFSGERFAKSFAKDINIRSNPSLSAKNVWEINRLLFLPHLAYNFRKSGDRSFLKRFIEINDSWIDNNPYLTGVNWYSNIEVNIRLINWFISWQILDADRLAAGDQEFRHFVERKWLPVIYLHCLYSYQNPSKYSSSNNHLVAEYSGLFIASSFWHFSESGKWQKHSRRGLEKEIRRQHSHGVNREEAAEYIQFITDFFLLPYLLAERNGDPFSEGYKKTLFDIFRYIRVFLDCKGHFPNYGDEDDGKCVSLDQHEQANNFKSLLVTAAIVFNDSGFKSPDLSFDSKNHFMFGPEGRALFDALACEGRQEQSCFYKDEGHFIFRKAEGGREVLFHFDAAPLGFLSIAAHGHADALSFIMSVNGSPLFADSGTYTYHTHPEWRRYFIGTLAHNTVRLGSKNQAVIGGPTLWLNHFRCQVSACMSDPVRDYIKASHDGYNGLGYIHQREVLFDKERWSFLITDTISVRNSNPVLVEIPFHLHPGVKATATDDHRYHLLLPEGGEIEFTLDDKLSPGIIRGRITPEPLGWFSGSFCVKEETSVIYSSVTINETTDFKYEIKLL